MNKLFVVAGIAGLALGGWKLTHRHHAIDGGNKLVANRIWIDHLPRGERDFINVFALVGEHSIGVFETHSRWQGRLEGFKYELSNGEVRALFPQTGDKETFAVKARSCDNNGFDFCLELDGGKHGVKKYFSMEGWEIDSQDKLEQRLQQIAK